MNRYDVMTDEDIQAEVARFHGHATRKDGDAPQMLRDACRERADEGLDELNRRRKS